MFRRGCEVSVGVSWIIVVYFSRAFSSFLFSSGLDVGVFEFGSFLNRFLVCLGVGGSWGYFGFGLKEFIEAFIGSVL